MFSQACVITARKRSLGQGNIFIDVCQEFCPQGRGVCSGGVSAPRICSWRGVCSRGPGLGGCGLLLWPSGLVAFWFGGLLIEGSLLVWSSGGGFSNPFNQKATTPEGHTRRPYQKTTFNQKASFNQKATKPKGHNRRA